MTTPLARRGHDNWNTTSEVRERTTSWNHGDGTTRLVHMKVLANGCAMPTLLAFDMLPALSINVFVFR